MVPVVLLTDGFLGNGSEPWKVPTMAELPEIKPRIAKDSASYKPYARDPETLAREWAIPGIPGFAHRIGGLEKSVTGNVSHDPDNHQRNCEIRENKVMRVVDMVPELEICGPDSGEVLIVTWGGTFGHSLSALRELRKQGKNVGLAHFNYINPLPANVAEIFKRFEKIIVCELNLGQFATYLRAKVPGFEYHQFNKVKGLPFTVNEITDAVNKLMEA
jgi:2-oxoglutarate ferredoxin oxidoreductase subunit alpha